VAAVQGNISSTDKWSGGADKILEIHAKYTREASEKGAKIVVWSETALPYNFFKNEYIHTFVSDLARECNVTILVSTFTEYQNRSWQLRNSLIAVNPDGTFGEEMYFKQRLVPFGEFVPMRELIEVLIPPLTEIGMLQEDLIAGEESTVLETNEGIFGCGICFDSIYEDIIRESTLGGAQVIAISTNDSWFADSAALYMHNSQSVLRAIENGRDVVRSANTGISSIIDPMGNIKSSLSANQEGVIVDEVYMRDNLTVYTVIGNVFIYICIVVICAAFCAEFMVKCARRSRKL
jgi:apolipoprotein N-acyltransferase